MAIPVQSDFWGQIGTNGLESLLDGQLQPWGGGSSSAGIKPVHLAALKTCRSGMAEGWIWPQGCAHLAAAVVLLGDRAASQLPSHLLHLCGGPEVAGSCRSVSELSSRARQVPDKPGLPAGTEGFYCCQYEGKKDASSLFFQICGDIVQTVPECSLCQNKHHLQMLWFCKKPQEEKLSDLTFTRVQKAMCQQTTPSPRVQEFHHPWGFVGSSVVWGDKAQWGHHCWVLDMGTSDAHWPRLGCVPLPTPSSHPHLPELTLRFLLDFGKPFSAGGSALLPCGRLAAWFAPALIASGSSGKRSGILDKRAKSMLTHSDFTSSLSFRGDRSSFLPKGTKV